MYYSPDNEGGNLLKAHYKGEATFITNAQENKEAW